MSPLPRARYPSSSSASATSSTLFASSSASGSGSVTDGWMGRDSLGGVGGSRGTRTSTSRSTVTTPASLFSDNETEVQPSKSRSLSKVGYDVEEEEEEDDGRPLIDFGDDTPRDHPPRARAADAVPATPGEKLRLLLRQMEAEVRSTHTHTSTATSTSHVPTREVSEATPARSNWREGRRIGALPLERSYSPEPQSRGGPGDDGEEAEEEEVLLDQVDPEDDEEEDSPPTPPLRITNPYLYASRKVSDERRSSSSASPRKPSRAAVLHASTSRSPPPVSPERPTQPIHQTPLQSYLARSRHSPSRKGKERSSADFAAAAAVTPQQTSRASHSPRKPARTPRRWSVELAPDDSVIFAQGLANGQEEEVELDLDEGEGESVEPPWMAESSVGDDDDEGEVQDEDRGRGIPDLPPPLDDSADYASEDENEESIHALTPPASRSRSRFSQSPSFTTAVAPSPARNDQSRSFSTSSRSRAPASPHAASPNISSGPDVSATHDRSASFSRRLHKPPAVEPVPVPEPVRVTPSTPPRNTASVPVAGQTPRPPGAWFSASKPTHGLGRSPQVRFSPLRQAHLAPSSPEDSQDISIHRLKLSPSKSTSPRHTDADTSFTRRLVASILPSSAPRVPPPSKTLAEARSDLERAARETDHARRQVELTQTAWLQALSASGVTATATEVLRTSWSWGRWMWWITLEIMLLWGVFRVTLECTSFSSASRLFDPLISAPSFALAVPLPTAISAFVIPSGHRRSGANFFDLLEQADPWRYLDRLGLGILNVMDDPGGGRARLSVPI